MLGVHGNGLSSAIWMKPTRRSALIEIVSPESFVWDYHSVGDAVGIRHWAVWNNTCGTLIPFSLPAPDHYLSSVLSGPKHPKRASIPFQPYSESDTP